MSETSVTVNVMLGIVVLAISVDIAVTSSLEPQQTVSKVADPVTVLVSPAVLTLIVYVFRLFTIC